LIQSSGAALKATQKGLTKDEVKLFSVMNNRTLLISRTSTVFLIAFTTALAQYSSHLNKSVIFTEASNSRININSIASNNQHYMSSFQQQKTAINLNKSNLKIAQSLKITTAENTQIVGDITVNNVFLKTINRNQVSVNLSPYLSSGINYVEISGNYKPVQNSVQIEFSGPGTKVTQQTGGNGILRQTLIIAVHS